MRLPRQNETLSFLWGIVGIALGLFLGWWMFSQRISISKVPLEQGAVIRSGQHGFINPLLGCEIAQQGDFPELLSLKRAIVDKIAQEKTQGKAGEIAVYFRLQNTGHWFGINEEEKYSPASLLKIPIAIAYFRLAQNSPEILERKIQYIGGGIDTTSVQFFQPAQKIQVGQSYTTEDLIYRMLVYSDNNAKTLLKDHLDANALADVYIALNLSIRDTQEQIDFMSARNYAFVFRVLYSSTYLNEEYSEKLLEMLSQSQFYEGIVAGIPSDISVAHKFGEQTFPSNQRTDNPHELHECGIVYYPNHPYLLCVMTRGKAFQDLAPAISEISAVVYNDVFDFYNERH